jgi:hypothetical protein
MLKRNRNGSLVLNRWCCATEVCLIAICVYEVNRLYAENEKKSNTGNFYVEQIINMPSRLGDQQGDWVGGIFIFIN